MNGPNATGRARVLLSFSGAYAALARRVATDLHDAHVEVRYDQWEGGGGLAAAQSVGARIGDATFVLPLLTPSDVAPTWIGDEWKRTIYDEARARGLDVLPLRGEGGVHVVPEFL